MGRKLCRCCLDREAQLCYECMERDTMKLVSKLLSDIREIHKNCKERFCCLNSEEWKDVEHEMELIIRNYKMDVNPLGLPTKREIQAMDDCIDYKHKGIHGVTINCAIRGLEKLKELRRRGFK